jgi:hypothetical protein
MKVKIFNYKKIQFEEHLNFLESSDRFLVLKVSIRWHC